MSTAKPLTDLHMNHWIGLDKTGSKETSQEKAVVITTVVQVGIAKAVVVGMEKRELTQEMEDGRKRMQILSQTEVQSLAVLFPNSRVFSSSFNLL